ncbi:preprotein translocase subunit YajC [Alkalilimnicola sp. S0819]|uniref:preprotein translocase subunit YajC n=1 Tax=Alkalilimnicola sp. S0819 TaxID=2613922 RepID=UPI0012624FDB|nr:preprotein translocase subunit YajC [Alkalilimnicola sp. S0819]KAB7628386.1 preprotein translocase subunit YajC [Alkalilimnicola sp. S0819]MPQ15289.1 preprotein translocase subunit YajC [Alkalilimnicola sp. S0819]
MSFFISDALAQSGGAAPAGGGFMQLLFPVALIAIFYVLLIRPQAKRAKEHKKMVEALAKGDEVVTNGGLLGRVIDVADDFATVEVAEGVQVKLQKGAVAAVMPKGTYKQQDKKAK